MIGGAHYAKIYSIKLHMVATNSAIYSQHVPSGCTTLDLVTPLLHLCPRLTDLETVLLLATLYNVWFKYSSYCIINIHVTHSFDCKVFVIINNGIYSWYQSTCQIFCLKLKQRSHIGILSRNTQFSLSFNNVIVNSGEHSWMYAWFKLVVSKKDKDYKGSALAIWNKRQSTYWLKKFLKMYPGANILLQVWMMSSLTMP